jgi:tRNA pseudouridine38-40 synthase
MRNVRCLPVPKEHLTTIWSVVSALLAKAVATAPGKLSVEEVRAMLRTGRRTPAVLTAPPQGLFLMRVFY